MSDESKTGSSARIESEPCQPPHAWQRKGRSARGDAPIVQSSLEESRRQEDQSPAPNWDLVHFDVGCARCGQDLRGLHEPKCPACALEFDWSAAVPLEELTCLHCGYHLYGLSETRCPECGNTFEWKDVLEAYQRSNSPFFEYRFRTRPFKAWTSAVWLSLRPWKLWKRITLHDPPRIGALILFWLSCVVLMMVVPYALAQSFGAVVPILGQWMGGVPTFFWGWGDFSIGLKESFATFGVMTALTMVMFLTLISMRWSLRRCRVRAGHIVRVCAYLIPVVMFLPVVTLLSMFFLDLLTIKNVIVQRDAYSILEWSQLVVMGVFLGYSVWHVAVAYKHYIKMKHAWGVALAANVAGTLGAMVAATLIALFGRF